MKESLSFSILCHCLQEGNGKKNHSVQVGKLAEKFQLDWSDILRLGDSHYVLPLLYHQLKNKNALKLLPQDAQEVLTQVYELNCRRNDIIYNEILNIVSLLHPAGIEPVLLKGSAGLFMGLYGERGLRLMGDVDFLVSKKNSLKCRELMQSAGYSPIEGLYLPDADEHHHGFPLVHEDHSIRFEIHERLADNPFLDSRSMIGDSQAIQVEGGILRIPSKTHFVINNILHHQVFDQGLENENILLYQLVDLYMIRDKFESQLDWNTIGAFFLRHSLEDAFCFTIDMLQNYFDQQLPKKIPWSLLCRIYYRQNKNRYNRLIHRLRR